MALKSLGHDSFPSFISYFQDNLAAGVARFDLLMCFCGVG